MREISSAPIVLFVKGDKDILHQIQFAIIGSRNPTRLGEEMGRCFAKEMALSGFAITSGMAIGIDGAAHQGALEANGKTIAVLGCGVECCYPKRHRLLREQILEKGAIVSEFSPNVSPRAEYFPRRNRIISGLSVGLLVVEAALKSGSLITARYSLEQNREVFAIPGSIINPTSRGCNQLIKQGAKLVESIDDILVELPPINSISLPVEGTSSKPQVENSLDPSHQKLLDCIDYAPTPIDKIIVRSGLSADKVSVMLLDLELTQLIETTQGGCVQRR